MFLVGIYNARGFGSSCQYYVHLEENRNENKKVAKN